MKYAVFSSTCDPIYDFFIPITAWAWRKIGFKPVCFVPEDYGERMRMILWWADMEYSHLTFKAPDHKKATYAQNARLYFGESGWLEVEDDDLILSSDVDILVFRDDFPVDDYMNILGADLVPSGQYPVCFCYGKVKTWRAGIGSGGYQRLLDERFGDDECDHYRGNRWSTDQEALYKAFAFGAVPVALKNRAKPGTQFAQHRCDRDDQNWFSTLGGTLLDAHLWRLGHEEANFEKICILMKTQYPNEDFTWLYSYREDYLKLL